MLVDGVGSAELADALADALTPTGRPPLRVSADDFQRPAGQRFEHGREDADAFRDDWLDDGALRREVLDRPDEVLPRLWDAARDRSARAARVAVPARGVVVVDGLFLLGRDLRADLLVHVALSPAALLRRGVPQWQLPSFAGYEEDVRPRSACHVLVLAEDAKRPAVVWRG